VVAAAGFVGQARAAVAEEKRFEVRGSLSLRLGCSNERGRSVDGDGSSKGRVVDRVAGTDGLL
jgi:hypothetical protein